MDNFYNSENSVGEARLEYEFRINKLKLDYYRLQEMTTEDGTKAEIKKRFDLEASQLRGLFNRFPELAIAASSLFFIPTIELPADQRLIHRIWLGDLPPFKVNEAIRQWFCAINDSVPGQKAAFRQILWIWRKEQLEAEPRFRCRSASDPFQAGEIITDAGVMQVNSLSALLKSHQGCYDDFINRLHQNHYYATLSDYFRLLILIHYGGVYMDADTLPYKPVSWFLAKPELPAIKQIGPTGDSAVRLSWLNLFLDETGMIIAVKGEPALTEIFVRLNQAYAGFNDRILPRDASQERHLFELFYAIWCEHWNATFISHDLFCQRYAVFYRDKKEEVICGVRGMRLLEDIISGEQRPLSPEELNSYRHAVQQLEAVGWTLSDPLMLEQFCEVYSVMEVPRIAYSLQMRSDIEHFHYYGVLCADPIVDRVNTLFEDYLLKVNGRNIEQGGFWQPVGKSSAASIPADKKERNIIFAAASVSSEEERTRMARLIFATSYLEYCSAGNPQQTDIVSLQRAQNIDPWLKFITLVLKPNGRFAGFFTAGLMAGLKQTPTPYLYREEMRPLDAAYDSFVEKNSRDNDYFIVSLALEAAERGKGYFPAILEQVERQAISQGAGRLTLCVWERARAFTLYKKWGFRQSDSSDYWLPLFADRLHFLEKAVVGAEEL